MEVFVDDGRRVMTRAIDARPEDQGVELFAEGGAAALEVLDAWQVESIWD